MGVVVFGLLALGPYLVRAVMRLCDRDLTVELSTAFGVNVVASLVYLAMAHFPAEDVPPALRVLVGLLIVAVLVTHVCGTTLGRAVLATPIYALAWILLLAALAAVSARIDPTAEDKIRALFPWPALGHGAVEKVVWKGDRELVLYAAGRLFVQKGSMDGVAIRRVVE